jgi:hypothetical protein
MVRRRDLNDLLTIVIFGGGHGSSSASHSRLRVKEMRTHRLVVSIASVVALLTVSDAAMAQMKQVMRYCKPDVERLCPGVPPGRGRIARCLKADKMEMSIGCGMALRRLKGEIGM